MQRAANAGWATAAAAPEVRAGTGGSPARRTVRRAHLQAHALIHDLLAQGHGIRAIARQLGWGRHTVQRYARAQSWQELVDGRWQGHRPSKLDAFKPHLQQRVQQGCINAVQLHQEVTALGFAGSYGLVRDYQEPYRRMPGPIAPAPPTVRQVTGWLTRHPDRLTDDEHLELEAILERCPELRAAAGHIRAFGEMLTTLGGQDLPAWIAAVGADELPGLGSFATGLERDLDAVTRGLTSRWSSGPIEGRVITSKWSNGRCSAVPVAVAAQTGPPHRDTTVTLQQQGAPFPSRMWPDPLLGPTVTEVSALLLDTPAGSLPLRMHRGRVREADDHTLA